MLQFLKNAHPFSPALPGSPGKGDHLEERKQDGVHYSHCCNKRFACGCFYSAHYTNTGQTVVGSCSFRHMLLQYVDCVTGVFVLFYELHYSPEAMIGTRTMAAGMVAPPYEQTNMAAGCIGTALTASQATLPISWMNTHLRKGPGQ